jgi:hypothetical protein
MPKHGSTHHRDARRVSVVQQLLPCKVCPKKFKQQSHLRRHARGAGDSIHRNYYSILSDTKCERCGTNFPKKGALGQHKRSLCGQLFVSQQPLPSGLPEIPPNSFMSSHPETTDNSTKRSLEGPNGAAPPSYAPAPTWCQEMWQIKKDWQIQDERANPAPPLWWQEEWQSNDGVAYPTPPHWCKQEWKDEQAYLAPPLWSEAQCQSNDGVAYPTPPHWSEEDW